MIPHACAACRVWTCPGTRLFLPVLFDPDVNADLSGHRQTLLDASSQPKSASKLTEHASQCLAESRKG